MARNKKNNIVNIMGFDYKIIYTDNTNDLMLNNVLCWGIHDPVNLKIYISTNQSKQKQEETLYHEIVHAIDYHTGTIGEYALSEDETESLAQGLATMRFK